jgi:hypothetical protein
MRRKDRRQRAHAPQRERRSSRVLPMLLGLLVLAFGGLAAVAFLMPELLAGSVPPPFDAPTVGMVAGGLAALLTVALMASVVRGRRRSAEQEFSRPQLTTVAALSPEEQAAARQDDESSPLLPEPPSMPPPAEVGAPPAAMSAAMGPEPAPAGVTASSQPAAEPVPNGERPSGSGVHIFAANQPVPNGHRAPEAPEPTPEAVPPSNGHGPFAWTPRHTEDGQLLFAEAWSFGPAGSRRRRRR